MNNQPEASKAQPVILNNQPEASKAQPVILNNHPEISKSQPIILDNRQDVSVIKPMVSNNQIEEAKFDPQVILGYMNAKSPLLDKNAVAITSVLGHQIPRGKMLLSNAIFYQSFLYIVGPLPSYSYFSTHPWYENYWGMWTFSGVYQFANILTGLWGHPIFPQLSSSLITYYAPITQAGPFNCTNYLTYVFSDFGSIGLIIVPLLFGFISNYFFFRALTYKRMTDIQLSALMLLGLILSVRGIITSGIFFWVLILLILFQAKILKMINQYRFKTTFAKRILGQT